jgi:hypothetical protein
MNGVPLMQAVTLREYASLVATVRVRLNPTQLNTEK